MYLFARFVGIWMVLVICIAVGVEGTAFGSSCSGTGTGDCTEKKNIVCDTNCKCTTDSFRNNTSECATKVALTKTCTASQPADQCADTNAVCDGTKLTCGCKSNFFVDKTGVCKAVIAALDGACDLTDPALDQCAVGNAECRIDGTAKCLCKATHYVKSSGCTIRKNLNDTCSAGECITHASCVSTICVCDAGYTPSPATKPTMCNSSMTTAAVEISTIVLCLMMAYFEVLHS